MRLINAVGRKWLERHVYEALHEDLGARGDITCHATISPEQLGTAELIAKAEGVIAGCDWAVVCGELTDPAVEWNFHVSDGEHVQPGQKIAEVHGPLTGILISERTALNGLAHLSGIATMTRKAVELVQGTVAAVLDTRKTTPGFRLAEKYAVHAGGGQNHRKGLYDEILIKENHIVAAGGIAKAVLTCRDWLRNHAKGEQIPIEIEVTSLDELQEALSVKPERILLDNFTEELLKQAVEINQNRCQLEASGGITLENIHQVALTGVHRISLGALTHSVVSLDLSLLVR